MMEKEIDKFSLLFFLRRVNANALRVVPCYISRVSQEVGGYVDKIVCP